MQAQAQPQPSRTVRGARLTLTTIALTITAMVLSALPAHADADLNLNYNIPLDVLDYNLTTPSSSNTTIDPSQVSAMLATAIGTGYQSSNTATVAAADPAAPSAPSLTSSLLHTIGGWTRSLLNTITGVANAVVNFTIKQPNSDVTELITTYPGGPISNPAFTLTVEPYRVSGNYYGFTARYDGSTATLPAHCTATTTCFIKYKLWCYNSSTGGNVGSTLEVGSGNFTAGTPVTFPAITQANCSTTGTPAFYGLAIWIYRQYYTDQGVLFRGTVPSTYYKGANTSASYDTNPQRRLMAQGICTNPVGATIAANIGYSSTYYETAGQTAPIVNPSCALGWTLSSVTVYKQTKKQDGTWDEHMISQSKPLAKVKVNTPKVVEYAKCFDGTTVCALVVQKNSDNGWYNCQPEQVAAQVDCTSYKTGLDLSTATMYRCKFGTYDVPLASCSSLLDRYGTIALTTTNPDTSQTVAGCAPTGWGYLNVFTLVRSMGCLLYVAFIPSSSSLIDNANTIKTAYQDTALGTATTMITGFFSPVTELSNFTPPDGTELPGDPACEGPAITIGLHDLASKYSNVANWTDGVDDMTFHPFTACKDPQKMLANYSRLFLGGTIWVTTFLLFIEMVFSVFGLRVALLSRALQRDRADDIATDPRGRR